MDDEHPTILDRLLRAGISAERADNYLAAGAVVLDGERVSDPSTPAGMPSRIVLMPT